MGSKRPRRFRGKGFLAAGGILLVVAGCLAAFLFREPPEQQLFQFDSAQVEMIRVMSGNSDKKLDCRDEASIREMTEFLNGFRYRSSRPLPVSTRSGFGYGIWLKPKGEEASFFVFDSNGIVVDDVFYESGSDYFQELKEKVS